MMLMNVDIDVVDDVDDNLDMVIAAVIGNGGGDGDGDGDVDGDGDGDGDGDDEDDGCDGADGCDGGDIDVFVVVFFVPGCATSQCIRGRSSSPRGHIRAPGRTARLCEGSLPETRGH